MTAVMQVLAPDSGYTGRPYLSGSQRRCLACWGVAAHASGGVWRALVLLAHGAAVVTHAELRLRCRALDYQHQHTIYGRWINTGADGTWTATGGLHAAVLPSVDDESWVHAQLAQLLSLQQRHGIIHIGIRNENANWGFVFACA